MNSTLRYVKFSPMSLLVVAGMAWAMLYLHVGCASTMDGMTRQLETLSAFHAFPMARQIAAIENHESVIAEYTDGATENYMTQGWTSDVFVQIPNTLYARQR